LERAHKSYQALGAKRQDAASHSVSAAIKEIMER